MLQGLDVDEKRLEVLQVDVTGMASDPIEFIL